jgi:hypothetical protein
MLSNQQSILIFLFLCIPIRFFLVWVAKYIPEKYLRYFGITLLIPTFVFLYLYFFNKRLNARESGGKTWWASMRLLHGALFLAAAIYAIQYKRLASLPLLVDVVLGITVFVLHHFYSDQATISALIGE